MHFDDFGINLAGYLTAELGLGEVARNYAAAIKLLGTDLSLQDASFITHQRKQESSLSGFSSANVYPANLVCINAPEIKHFLDRFGYRYFQTKYNIAYWWWEIEEIPDDWKSEFYRFDELWVGSNFARENFQKVSPIPVLTMPPHVAAQPNGLKRTVYALKESEFVFLYVFDFFSCFERKNPLAVVEAFKLAFPDGNKARLVIKSTNGFDFPEQFRALRHACDHKQITLLDSYMSKKELCGLIENCDCYVSLHRAEGFGLPIAEAMLLKKPIIATGWSGNLDFTTPENSLLVQYGFSTNSQDYGPYKRGMRWAEPDVEHAAKLMRIVVQDQAQAKSLGQKGAATIQQKYSKEAVAAAIGSRLEQIKGKVHRVEQLAKYKRGLLGLADDVDLAGATVTVPSRESNVNAKASAKSQSLTFIDDAKLVDQVGQLPVPKYPSKLDWLADQIEKALTVWWHRPVLGVPLRFFSICLRRIILHALSGEPARIIRSQVIDKTFEGIAQIAKMDADRIEELEKRIQILESEGHLADRSDRTTR